MIITNDTLCVCGHIKYDHCNKPYNECAECQGGVTACLSCFHLMSNKDYCMKGFIPKDIFAIEIERMCSI